MNDDRPKILARDQIRIAARLLGIPEPFVRQTMARMKSDGRLPATRPVAAAVTPQSLTRLILGLSTSLPSKATELEVSLGALPRLRGDGAPTASEELEALIAEAVGLNGGDIDFCAGDILIGVTNLAIHIVIHKFDGSATSRSYRAEKTEDEHLTRYVRIPLQALRMLALELMGE